MKRTRVLPILLVLIISLSACGDFMTPDPGVVEKPVLVTPELEKVFTQEIVVTQEVLIEEKSLPLFWDEASDGCAKIVPLAIATYGDHQSRFRDVQFGIGVLQNEWEILQPCVQVETSIIQPEASIQTASEFWAEGSNADVVFIWPDAQEAGSERQWVLPLETYFDYKNPYSENPTWYEDFPYPEQFYTPHTDGHTYWVRSGIRTGSNGLAALVYNASLLEQAGVPTDKIIPTTWSEWVDNLAKCKAAGKTGLFLPLTGATQWEWPGWMAWWAGDFFSGDLTQELYNVMIDGSENPQGTISNQKLVRAVIEGGWDLEDPRAFEFFEVSKRLFDYIQADYVVVPELVDELPAEFLIGNACYAWASAWRLGALTHSPDLPFTWGTTWLPWADADFSQYASGHFNVEQGLSQASSEMAPLAISATAARDPDVLQAAVDFAMYLTSPRANQIWCRYQSLPCTEPGTSFDEIVGENAEMRRQLYGFYNPPRDGTAVPRNTMVPIQWIPGGSAELNRRFINFYEGKISKEEFIKMMMADILQNARDQCRRNLEARVEGWEFCQDLPLD